jgi:hypothetical protein
MVREFLGSDNLDTIALVCKIQLSVLKYKVHSPFMILDLIFLIFFSKISLFSANIHQDIVNILSLMSQLLNPCQCEDN